MWTLTQVPAAEDPHLQYAIVNDLPPGAQTISGINSHFWPADFARIAAIPQAQRGPAVTAFYQANFWNADFAQIASNDVAKRIWDMDVNSGERPAVGVAQDAVNILRNQAGLPLIAEDEVIGPATVAAINAADPVAFVATFIEGRCAALQQDAQKNPLLVPDLPELLKRARA
jgi:lysozyme family protein